MTDKPVSMIERVTIAIFYPDWGKPKIDLPDWQLRTARAAIAAMREPTSGMIKAGMHGDLIDVRADIKFHHDHFVFPHIAIYPRDLWNDMIDKALEDD